jgi:hypothetical protein
MANVPRTVRVEDDEWEAFGKAIRHTDPLMSRTRIVRSFIRWYLQRGNCPRLPSAEQLVYYDLLPQPKDGPWRD